MERVFEGEMHIDVSNIDVSGVVSAVIQCETSKCYICHHNLNCTFSGGKDRPERYWYLQRG